MYLTILNKKEQDLFLDLAFELVFSDGKYTEEEKKMVSDYCDEMKIPLREMKEDDKTIEDILSIMKQNSDKRVQKIIIFELIGLAVSDGNYDDKERGMILDMESAFKIEEKFAEECEKILNEYIKFQERINELVLN